jgi:hypothetical protein
MSNVEGNDPSKFCGSIFCCSAVRYFGYVKFHTRRQNTGEDQNTERRESHAEPAKPQRKTIKKVFLVL